MRRRIKRERRDHFPIARSLPVLSLPMLSRVAYLTPYEDRRRFVFQRAAMPAFSLPRSAARLVVPKPMRRTELLRSSVAFAAPSRVAVCVRRSRRREVLFANGVGGARGAKRRPRRSMFSDVSCRR